MAFIISSIPGVFFLPDIRKRKKQIAEKEK